MVTQNRLYTVVEFEQFVDRDDDRRLELINGEIVEKVPTEAHGVVTARLASRMLVFSEDNDLGRVSVEPRHTVAGDTFNARIPDIAFTSKARALPLTKKGSVPQLPDLAVEVQSPGQSDKFLADKADFYLANGARMVWLIYPDKHIVEVLTRDDRKLLNDADSLDGGDVLPGFSVKISYLFQD